MIHWPLMLFKLMPGKRFFVYSLFLLTQAAYSSVVVPSAIISKDTVWKTDTIKISTNIIIGEKATLYINPGVVIAFQGSFDITVYGAVSAIGNNNDSIKFTIKPGLETQGWSGIRFIGNQKLTSFLSYCSFMYGNSAEGGAIYAKDAMAVKIDHSTFSHNKAVKGGALYFDNSGVEVTNCHLFDNNSTNEGGGIYINSCVNALVSKNYIYNNNAFGFGGGIYSGSSKTRIKLNRIYNNSCNDAVKGFSGGGGIASVFGSDSIINNLIFNNETSLAGGGVFYLSATGLFINNDVCNNRANDGGGISITDSNIELYNSIIWNNLSTTPSINSHNLYIVSAAESRFTNCLVNINKNYLVDTEKTSRFINNINADPLYFRSFTEVGISAGASDLFWLINGNSPAKDAGTNAVPLPLYDIIERSRIDGSKVDIGAYEYQLEQEYKGELTSDIFWYGKIKVTGDISVLSKARLTIFPATQIDFTGPYGVAVHGQLIALGESQKRIIFSRDVVKKNKYPDTAAEGWKGLQFYFNGSENISQLNYCVFEYCNNISNSVSIYGGAVYSSRATRLNVANTIIRYCAATRGGAAYIYNAADVKFVNSLFYGNYSSEGGIFYAENAGLSILSCTSYSNEALTGGGVYCVNSSPVIKNSIFWKNSAKKGAQIYLSDINSDPNISYSVIDKGIDGIEGPGAGTNFTGVYNNNIDKNPLFNNPDKDNQFSLKTQSPCINAGNPATTPNETGQIDLGGNTRFAQTIIDIGAYEFQKVSLNRPIADLSLVANSGKNVIDLSTYFSATGISDTLKFQLSAVSDTSAVSVKISGTQLQVLPRLNATGTDTLVVIAQSVYGAEISDTFLVQVNYLSLPLSSPFNNYRFKLNEDQVFKWFSVPSATISLKGYLIKIAEIQNDQTPEQAIVSNPIWYMDTVLSADNSIITSIVSKKFPVYGKMAWQVFALGTNGNIVGISSVQTFYGAPLLKMFYAGSNVVNVDTTIIHDLSRLKGIGSITIPGKDEISFVFSDLSLIMENNSYHLYNGIVKLPYTDSITLTSAYLPNGNALLVIDSLDIDRRGFTVLSQAMWDIPIAESARLRSPKTTMNYNNYQPTGILGLESLKLSIGALPGAKMEFGSYSTLSVSDGYKFTPSLNGSISVLIDNPAQYTGDSIRLSFSGISTIDYFQVSKANQQKLGLNSLVNVVPVHFIVDLSGSQSPINYTADWKGIWVDQFKITFNDKEPNYPLALNSSDGILVNSGINYNAKYTISSNGIEIKVDTTFRLSIPSNFNGFTGSLKTLKFTRPKNNGEDEIYGGAIIPYIDEDFENSYVIRFDGMHYAPNMTPQLTDFSFYPYSEKMIEQMQIMLGFHRFDGIINQSAKTIQFLIPDTVDIQSIPVHFIVRGNKVTIAGGNIVRDVTFNNFSSPTFLRVHAGNGTYSDYLVTVLKVITDMTGIDESKSTVSVYPNPTHDYIKISGEGITNSTASIFDTKGKLIMRKIIENQDNVLCVSDLPIGVYILYIQNKETVRSLRIIKE